MIISVSTRISIGHSVLIQRKMGTKELKGRDIMKEGGRKRMRVAYTIQCCIKRNYKNFYKKNCSGHCGFGISVQCSILNAKLK